jgi:hypothetical protein
MKNRYETDNLDTLKLYRSVLRLTLSRHKFSLIWIIIAAITIGLLINTLIKEQYIGETAILIVNDKTGNSADLGAYIVQTEDFYKKVIRLAETKNVSLDENSSTYEGWKANIKGLTAAGGRIIKIEVKGVNKIYTLNQIELISDVLNENLNLYLASPSKLNLKIVTAPRVSNQPIYPDHITFIIFSAISGCVLAFLFLSFGFIKIYLKRNRQRQRYLRYIRLKKNSDVLKKYKRQLKPRGKIFKKTQGVVKMGSATEEEVKDKLNRLIRGEDILPQITKQEKKTGSSKTKKFS